MTETYKVEVTLTRPAREDALQLRRLLGHDTTEIFTGYSYDAISLVIGKHFATIDTETETHHIPLTSIAHIGEI